MWERNTLFVQNRTDKDGNPSGGDVRATGLDIVWQDGPLGRPPKPATGAFVEDVIEAARQRLEFYQKASGGRYACRENSIAITHLETAMLFLHQRRWGRLHRDILSGY